MLPRMPGPAPDFPSLLYMLGVGSMIWYAVVLAFPLLLLGARRIDADRQGRLRAIAIPAGAIFALIAATSVLQYWLLYREAPMQPPLGAYLPQALRIHAETSRTKRKQRAEERAAKIGVKLVFPLVFCVFPGVYMVCIGPAAISIYRAFVVSGAP